MSHFSVFWGFSGHSIRVNGTHSFLRRSTLKYCKSRLRRDHCLCPSIFIKSLISQQPSSLTLSTVRMKARSRPQRAHSDRYKVLNLDCSGVLHDKRAGGKNVNMSHCVNMSENVTWTREQVSPHVTFYHYFGTQAVIGCSRGDCFIAPRGGLFSKLAFFAVLRYGGKNFKVSFHLNHHLII